MAKPSPVSNLNAQLCLKIITRCGKTFIALAKGHPDQPRVPAGNPTGGQWTSTGGGNTATANTPSKPNTSPEPTIRTNFKTPLKRVYVASPTDATYIPPKYNIFVGGAGDDSIGHSVLNSTALTSISVVNYYAAYDQRPEINDLISQMPTDSSINLIGHSCGGDTVAFVATDNPKRINNLITIDPVSRFKPDFAEVQTAVTRWVNIAAIPVVSTLNTRIARIGGRWKLSPANFAHTHTTTTFDHDQFDAMMHYPLPTLNNLSVVKLINNQ